jgi:uncharacterized protein (TIGR03437 family)
VDQNLAPVISMSYGGCELSASLTLRSIAQQANAQGISWMISSGDSAAATCDRSSPTPQAGKGETVSFPASLPEVTAVGGTEFSDDSGSYWALGNTASRASALSYIPERVWNDSALLNRIDGGGGGASAVYPKPVWQTGPGVPADGFRDLPDVSFSSSGSHDGYEIVSGGLLYIAGGTSAASPVFAGMVALLNHSLAAGAATPIGLGNLNPVLYRLAQGTTDVFHDITAGDNIVPCQQASPGCLNGLLGYAAAPGYDLASGLGSVDAAHLIAEWNTGNASVTSLSANPSSFALTDSIQLTATVSGASGIPTGTVTFVSGDVELGSAVLAPGAKSSTALLNVNGTLLAGGSGMAGASYSGDGTFLPSSGTSPVALQLPASGSYVIPSVTPNPVHQVGTTWPYVLRLTENAGVATAITVFTVNGVNNLPGLPALTLAAHGSMSVSLSGSGLTVPLNRVYHFEGVDAGGAIWSRDLTVPFIGSSTPSIAPSISLTVSPSEMQQNPQADPSCQWSQQITVQELGGFQVSLSGLSVGGVNMNGSLPQVFGTTRLAPRGMLTGVMCFANIIPPAPKSYTITGAAETGTSVTASASVTFAAAPATAAALSIPTSPLTISIADAGQTGTGTIPLGFNTSAPAWKVTLLPSAQQWLTVSAAAGAGNATLTLQASGAGLSNGVYNAIVSIEASNTVPQSVQIPVSFVVGASSDLTITGIGNAASGVQGFAPGELVAVYGSGLAPTTAIAGIQPLPLTLVGTSATVNGVAAPLWFVSPNQINLQIPYETAAGTAVLGVMNGGKVASHTLAVTSTAPGIFASGSGSLVPSSTAAAGQTIVGFITGDGDVTPTLATGATAVAGTALSQLPHARQTFTLTVGGEPAAIVFKGIVPGLIGVTQVNFMIPSDLNAGPQAVVVTVGGVSSMPVNLTISQ